MSNTPSQVNFSTPLATFLATQPPGQVAGQTYNLVVNTLKADRTGFEANATQQAASAGQLLHNVRDDLFLATYAALQGQQSLNVQTTDATVNNTALHTFTTDGEAYFISVRVGARQTAQSELVTGVASGMFYRTGGAVLVLDPLKTISRVGLATADFDLVVTGQVVNLALTGIAATTIRWTPFVLDVKEVLAP